jgi:hypothetical protein
LTALGGHLSGDYVVHSLVRDDPASVEVLECSIAAQPLLLAVGVLQAAGCTVTAVDATHESERQRPYDTLDGIEMHQQRRQTLSVRTPDGDLVGAPPLTVELSCHRFSPPSTLIFDWHHLVASRGRLYVRPISTSTPTKAPPPLDLLLRRVHRGSFCLSACCPPSNAADGAHLHGRAICRAARLALEDPTKWRMDDLFAGRRGWVATTWELLPEARTKILSIGGDSAATRPPTVHDHCPICYEAFLATDAVVNLPCNHNFHAVCNRSVATFANNGLSVAGGGGLCAWLSGGQHTCPCCRAEVCPPPA